MIKKNGFAPTLIFIIVAVLGVVGYFGYKNYFQSYGNVPNEPEELKGLPIYPNSYYDPNDPYSGKSEYYLAGTPCGDTICKVTEYNFITDDTNTLVIDWYKKNVQSFTDPININAKSNIDNPDYGYYHNAAFTHRGIKYGIEISHRAIDIIKPGSAYEWPVATQVETSNWSTFTDKDGVFTFRYPKDLIVRQGETVSKWIDAGHIDVKVKSNTTNASSQVEASNIYEAEPEYPTGFAQKNTLPNLGGLDVTVAYGITGVNSEIDIFIVGRGISIHLDALNIGGDVTRMDHNELDKLSKILSTFKFLK